ncbi:heme anaerobic degradation radical SAM methyltransferase ChuW/HutW [Neisseria flavescens]|uniref:Radical SAM domain protein n=1 Tax=Neisseria flavescens NRL30031/H210 TaxID=546264 RepID=C0EMQ0_NEIFL|nr:heme anaerobic degradation radical SAM methyltransferase ChuW/HutW [Neisseria flavescens]SPY01662.1 coproporphyrinogen III oxidase [Neisseria meningitidis]EEG33741.1 radical SAM domain protein [Neisseria flavescens NRL30031/H210]QCL69816.1 heme anaerobic degradation radical SAM methyltransferase ChuW/HutW [Neisseria flavescens]SPY06803.1 coproporphyrinogen III oxidase [Neisseria meningitidis]STZ66404.1 coproporphyrinogen III oxidase [Neisseria flavescens]
MVQQLVWTPKQSAPKAFPERQALMPVWGGVPMPRPQWQNIWKKKLPHATDVDALAYLHIPFCANHCVFCGFYRNAWKDSQSSVYTDKIIEEMAAESEVRTGKGKIRAVYFGGGTPTALLTEDLVRLIRACYQYLPLAEDCEFTIEGRMSHFDLEKAKACIEAGANRISIGVQTFNTAIRRRLGRKHSGDEAFEYLAKLCELDAVIVADLMFGLPNQTDDVWQNDIARAAELPLSGLDTYAFNLYPMLPINRMIEKGAFPTPPGFDIQADQYAYTVETLLEKGWEQVSNSHFAYPGRGERNRYNTLIKSDIPCLAFGSGAGGNFGGFSYQVQGDLESYLATPKDEKNIAFMSGHSPNKALLSKVQHDIETGRLNPLLFDGNKAAQKLIAQWQEMQLFKEPDSDGLIRLNTSGRYWSPTLIRKLMLTLPTQEKDQTMQKLSAEQQTMLRQSLEKNPGQVLEMLAAQNQCSFEDVIRCLPEENVRQTEGSRIVEILQAVSAWDESVTFIAHTPDAIVEVSGKLPNGKVGRGFYNFDHPETDGGVHGHIYYENCATIYLLERPFMGKATCSLNFINRNGGAMFKIFVGRDEAGELKQHQIEAMRKLFDAA